MGERNHPYFYAENKCSARRGLQASPRLPAAPPNRLPHGSPRPPSRPDRGDCGSSVRADRRVEKSYPTRDNPRVSHPPAKILSPSARPAAGRQPELGSGASWDLLLLPCRYSVVVVVVVVVQRSPRRNLLLPSYPTGCEPCHRAEPRTSRRAPSSRTGRPARLAATTRPRATGCRA
jgi:hypothetical protein